MIFLYLLIGISALFDFLSGLRDSGNFVSTLISTRALPPRTALAVAAIAELAGPFIFGVAVAYTFGKGILDPRYVSLKILLAALISALLWNLVTLALAQPSSSTHAVLGGLVGAALVGAGIQAIYPAGLIKTLTALFISPLLGLAVGYGVTRLVFFFSRSATPRVNSFFRYIQIATSIGLALSYGTNDAQKTMGLVTLALLTGGVISSFSVPYWVVLLSAGSIALGIGIGGWRVIRTLGAKFYRIRPVHGFSSQFSATLVILSASLLGGPVSSTQVITASILGAGSADRINKVRWNIAGQILTAWLLTIPICALSSAGIWWLLGFLMP